MNNMLNEVENTLLLEILVNIYQPNPRFFNRIPKRIRVLKQQINMKNYSIRHQDPNAIKESIVYLNRKSVERILIQICLLLIEWDNEEELNNSLLDDVFSRLGEIRIESLKDISRQYQGGENNLEEFFTKNEVIVFDSKIKNKALKLFKNLYSTDSSKIDVSALNKLNKGPLIKVWGKVANILKTIKSPNTPPHIKAMAIGAILYVIFPFDAIPDYIPLGGLVDDAAVIAFAFEKISKIAYNKSKK